MRAQKRKKYAFVLLQAVRIGVGSALAMLIAMFVGLEFAISSAAITMLTIVSTKAEVLRLSLYRIITFVITLILCFVIFNLVANPYIAYGLFLLCLVFITDYFDLRATLSVNAVIGTHFLTTLNFGMTSIINELSLVLIGISMAILLNFTLNNPGSEKRLKHNVTYTDTHLQSFLFKLSDYMKTQTTDDNLWNELSTLTEDIYHFEELAFEFKGNTLGKSKDSYIDYFNKRQMQCETLDSIKKPIEYIKAHTAESEIISVEIRKIGTSISSPTDSSNENTFENLFYRIKPQESAPEAFANLYHILMVLKEFDT